MLGSQIARLGNRKLCIADPTKCKLKILDWTICVFILLIAICSIGLFIAYVNPSLNDQNDLRIGADSAYYLWRAGVKNVAPSGAAASDLEASWISMQGSVIGPTLIAQVLRSNLLILCFNCAIFIIAVVIFSKSVSVSIPLFTALLLVNPSILVSLLTLNKEILILLSIALLFYYLTMEKRPWPLLLGTLLVAFLGRWQQVVIIIAFLAIEWSARKLHNRRKTLLVILIAFITIISPYTLTYVDVLLRGFTEMEGNLIVFLVNAQRHFLYFVVMLPKIALNLYGSGVLFLLHGVRDEDRLDVYNTYIGPLSSLANIAITIAALFCTSCRFSLKNDCLFFAAIYAVLYSALPLVETRYYFPIYIVLSLEVAYTRRKASSQFRTRQNKHFFVHGQA